MASVFPGQYSELLQMVRPQTQEENPQGMPFQSKYSARKVYQEMIDVVAAKLNKTLTERVAKGQAAPAADSIEARVEAFGRGTAGLLRMYLGQNFIDAEEVSDGERHLKASWAIMEPMKADPR